MSFSLHKYHAVLKYINSTKFCESPWKVQSRKAEDIALGTRMKKVCREKINVNHFMNFWDIVNEEMSLRFIKIIRFLSIKMNYNFNLNTALAMKEQLSLFGTFLADYGRRLEAATSHAFQQVRNDSGSGFFTIFSYRFWSRVHFQSRRPRRRSPFCGLPPRSNSRWH